MKKSNQQGFTLIELMIVLAIVGFLSLYAVPSMNSVIQEKRIVRNMNDIKGGVAFAKSSSLQKRNNMLICANSVIQESQKDYLKIKCENFTDDKVETRNVVIGSVIGNASLSDAEYYVVPDRQFTAKLGRTSANATPYIYIQGSGLIVDHATPFTSKLFNVKLQEGNNLAYVCLTSKNQIPVMERSKNKC